MRILSFLILCVLLITAYRATQKSPHGTGLKISCNNCHNTESWQFDRKVYSFDHNKTRLPLSGQHALLNCKDCHISLVFSDAKFNCIDCHRDVHQSTVGTVCSRCHTPESWLVSNITEIHRTSRFPLLGAHRTADCVSCHKSENPVRFDVTGVNCIDCHRANYLSTTNPDHRQAGFSEECAICHKVNAFQWEGAGINHDFFPLKLGHSIPKCADCHKSGIFTGLSPNCYSCHQQDYLSTTNPNHSTSNFPVTCQQCHSLNPGWKPATFNHGSFPLTFGHATVSCTDCHKNGNYSSVSPACYSCHQQDYLAAKNPDHSASQFSTDCKICHSTNPGWRPASFDHGAFPLTLGHASVSCAACHVNGNYSSISPECSSCHLTDYNNTTNPNHKSLNFPLTCTTCHTTNPGWAPASYKQHDTQYFPIYSGRHNGLWTTCAQCHTQPSNYAVFSCIVCHEHSKANTDPHHGGVGNYTYTATSCYSCHRTGSGGD